MNYQKAEYKPLYADVQESPESVCDGAYKEAIICQVPDDLMSSLIARHAIRFPITSTPNAMTASTTVSMNNGTLVRLK